MDLLCKPGDLGSIPDTHIKVEGENTSHEVDLKPPHMCIVKTKTIYNLSLLLPSIFPTGHKKGNEEGVGCIGAGGQGQGLGWGVGKRVTARG